MIVYRSIDFFFLSLSCICLLDWSVVDDLRFTSILFEYLFLKFELTWVLQHEVLCYKNIINKFLCFLHIVLLWPSNPICAFFFKHYMWDFGTCILKLTLNRDLNFYLVHDLIVIDFYLLKIRNFMCKLGKEWNL